MKFIYSMNIFLSNYLHLLYNTFRMKNLFITLFSAMTCVVLTGCPTVCTTDDADAGAETDSGSTVDLPSTETGDVGTETGDGDPTTDTGETDDGDVGTETGDGDPTGDGDGDGDPSGDGDGDGDGAMVTEIEIRR
jgi:hypothetical protein